MPALSPRVAAAAIRLLESDPEITALLPGGIVGMPNIDPWITRAQSCLPALGVRIGGFSRKANLHKTVIEFALARSAADASDFVTPFALAGLTERIAVVLFAAGGELIDEADQPLTCAIVEFDTVANDARSERSKEVYITIIQATFSSLWEETQKEII